MGKGCRIELTRTAAFRTSGSSILARGRSVVRCWDGPTSCPGTSCFFGEPPLTAPLCLFLHQRPDAIPLGRWSGDAELRNSLLGTSRGTMARRSSNPARTFFPHPAIRQPSAGPALERSQKGLPSAANSSRARRRHCPFWQETGCGNTLLLSARCGSAASHAQPGQSCSNEREATRFGHHLH